MNSLKNLSLTKSHFRINFVFDQRPACIRLSEESLEYINEICHSGDNQHRFPKDHPHHTIIIFSICSDNRISTDIESWLNRKIDTDKVYLCILGDYDEEIDDSWKIIAGELRRIISKKNADLPVGCLPVNSPISDYASQAKNIVRLSLNTKSYCTTETLKKEDACKPWTSLQATTARSPVWTSLKDNHYLKIASELIKGPLLLESTLVTNTMGLAINLSDNKTYPRSTINTLGKEELIQLMNAIANIPEIVELKIPFADMHQWPNIDQEKMYSRLLKLDLRGNNLQDFSFLTRFKNLKRLNISANHLRSIPIEVFNIKSLEVLNVYKNSINFIDDKIAMLEKLKKLSLYRNLIESVPKTLTQCRMLEYLNLGANPIKSLPESITDMPHLKKLGLRNCKLSEIPHVLQRKHHIEIDMTKNLVKIK